MKRESSPRLFIGISVRFPSFSLTDREGIGTEGARRAVRYRDFVKAGKPIQSFFVFRSLMSDVCMQKNTGRAGGEADVFRFAGRRRRFPRGACSPFISFFHKV